MTNQIDIILIESPHRLTISDVNSDDAGYYKCAANNEFSSAYHAEQIIIDGNKIN